MQKYLRSVALAALVASSAAGCKDFLSGGDLSNDPNRPQIVTNRNIFVGIQSATWAEYVPTYLLASTRSGLAGGVGRPGSVASVSSANTRPTTSW